MTLDEAQEIIRKQAAEIVANNEVHAEIMKEACDVDYGDGKLLHCTCVPFLRETVRKQAAQINREWETSTNPKLSCERLPEFNEYVDPPLGKVYFNPADAEKWEAMMKDAERLQWIFDHATNIFCEDGGTMPEISRAEIDRRIAQAKLDAYMTEYKPGQIANND